MDLLIDRGRVVRDEATIGFFCVNNRFECYSLEDVVRQDPNPETPHNEGKVWGRTAIPAGRYRITLASSPKFGPNTLTVNDVPGYTGVRIHGGNSAEHTAGCPLLGDGLAGTCIAAGTSGPAVNRVKAVVATAIAAGEEIWLTITDP